MQDRNCQNESATDVLSQKPFGANTERFAQCADRRLAPVPFAGQHVREIGLRYTDLARKGADGYPALFEDMRVSSVPESGCRCRLHEEERFVVL